MCTDILACIVLRSIAPKTNFLLKIAQHRIALAVNNYYIYSVFASNRGAIKLFLVCIQSFLHHCTICPAKCAQVARASAPPPRCSRIPGDNTCYENARYEILSVVVTTVLYVCCVMLYFSCDSYPFNLQAQGP